MKQGKRPGKKTGILVHGCHLEAFDWRGIMWGRPPREPGRLPKAVRVALDEQADVMVFGTGASNRDGKPEGEYTRDFLIKHFHALNEFSVFEGIDLARARARIESISVPECTSRNTMEEMTAAGRIFLESGVEKVILVSSPTHISRCIRDALSVFADPEFHPLLANLFATASDTSYLGGRAEDVAIFEPPHRGDRGAFLTPYLVQRIFRIPEESMDGFLKRLDRLLEEYEV